MPYHFGREQAAQVIEKARAGIREYFRKHGLVYAIFGKSKGLDSSVIAGLLSRLEGVRPLGVLMPLESHPDDERIGREVLEHFRIPWLKVDLGRAYRAILGELEAADGLQEQLLVLLRRYDGPAAGEAAAARRRLACGNIKVRLRMIALYHLAALCGRALVVSTDNLSELMMGFWTLNGDVGDLAPIQMVFKGLELYTIAEVLGVPRSSREAVPSDGLDVTDAGTDEDQLGLPYYQLDRVLVELIKSDAEAQEPAGETRRELVAQIASRLALAEAAVSRALERLLATKFKRCWPARFTREQLGLVPVEQIEP